MVRRTDGAWFERQEGGQVGIDTKKSAARVKAEPRAAAPKSQERSQVAAKRPSVPPTAPKKAAKSVPPPPAASAANDNDRTAKRPLGSLQPMRAPTPIGRGRLPTGSLHTEARPPQEAESIKARLTTLIATQQKLAELKRSANKHFYEIGQLLHRVREQRLFEVKGYGSFESFVEREVNLGQQFCLTAVRIYETFLPEAVASLGMARLSAALRAIDDEPTGVTSSDSIRGARSPIPPHKL
jgi:hypothetical protein